MDEEGSSVIGLRSGSLVARNLAGLGTRCYGGPSFPPGKEGPGAVRSQRLMAAALENR